MPPIIPINFVPKKKLLSSEPVQTKGESELGIWIVRKHALALGQFCQQHLGGRLYLPWTNTDQSPKLQFQAIFHQHSSWLMIMTTAIAVRYLDGLLESKFSDPAVVVMDEGAHHIISLLSSHEGRANHLTYAVANCTQAVPVITTATEALKPLVMGIGCRKDISLEQVHRAIEHAVAMVGHKRSELRELVTIEMKAKEKALLEWSKNYDVPLRIITKEWIQQRPWVTEPSAWVLHNIGVEGVCEPCALLANPKGELILPKMAMDGVAIAITKSTLKMPFSH